MAGCGQAGREVGTMGRVNIHLLAIDGAVATAERATIEGLLRDGKLVWLDLDAIARLTGLAGRRAVHAVPPARLVLTAARMAAMPSAPAGGRVISAGSW
jgi:hypothetical protein